MHAKLYNAFKCHLTFNIWLRYVSTGILNSKKETGAQRNYMTCPSHDFIRSNFKSPAIVKRIPSEWYSIEYEIEIWISKKS